MIDPQTHYVISYIIISSEFVTAPPSVAQRCRTR